MASRVGWYRRQVLPRAINSVCSAAPARELRQRAASGLSGRVVEIGFGSGLSVEHYPTGVVEVDAVEPSDVAWRLAQDRVARSPVPIERVGLDAGRLPLEDASCDCALSVWTLCTVPDVALAVAELRRVLKPGGTLHFVEHGLAPDERVRRWQHRLDPVQQRVAGGCRLTRPTVELLVEGGFEIRELDRFYQPGRPKALLAESLGIAATPP